MLIKTKAKEPKFLTPLFFLNSSDLLNNKFWNTFFNELRNDNTLLRHLKSYKICFTKGRDAFFQSSHFSNGLKAKMVDFGGKISDFY